MGRRHRSRAGAPRRGGAKPAHAQLLTYSPSGAPVAAPTTSLPELLGDERNWDYRFAWPRDASIGIAAFLAAGKHREARAFLAWLLHASRLARPRLPALFTLHGRPGPAERELHGWPGYAKSRPVRVGNGAADQHQLDGYGWVLDAAWLLTDAGQDLDGETWRAMRGFADHVVATWEQPDAGIWERRDEPRHHVHSKLMAWLALDRAARIAFGAAGAPLGGRPRGKRHATESRPTCGPTGSTTTSAPTRPPMGPATSTRPCSSSRSWASNRPTRHGSWAPSTPSAADSAPAGRSCTDTWTTTASPAERGRSCRARSGWSRRSPPSAVAPTPSAMFDELAALGGPLGLFAEEMDPGTGAHLGNFPQALTHASLLQAAAALDAPTTKTAPV